MLHKNDQIVLHKESKDFIPCYHNGPVSLSGVIPECRAMTN